MPQLLKQHSHPVLPSQMAAHSPIVVQRQLSQPGRSRVTLHQQHQRLAAQSSFESTSDSSIYTDMRSRNTPPTIRIETVAENSQSGRDSPVMAPQGEEVLVQKSNNQADSEPSASISQRTSPLLIVAGPVTGSLDYAPTLRVRDEFQRSISTPQVRGREIIFGLLLNFPFPTGSVSGVLLG